LVDEGNKPKVAIQHPVEVRDNTSTSSTEKDDDVGGDFPLPSFSGTPLSSHYENTNESINQPSPLMYVVQDTNHIKGHP